MSIKKSFDEFKAAIDDSTSMADASTKLGIHFSTFRRKAIEFGLYAPNQCGKGVHKSKREGHGLISLADILDGKHPQYQTYKLKLRLYKENLKQNICEVCGCYEWQGKELQCELDHIDGDRTNHRLENLRIICPNCHSQTETFRFKRGNTG